MAVPAALPVVLLDPSDAELQGFSCVRDVMDWANMADDQVAAFATLVGAGLSVSEVAMVRISEIEAAFQGAQVGNGPVLPVHFSRLRLLHRACRLAAGLPAEDTSLGALLPASTQSKAPAPPKPASKLKLSSLVDTQLDGDLQELPPAEVQDMFQHYARRRGAPPHKDHEPTEDQLSAVHQLLRADRAPYVDFALFGPHGRRLLKKLSHAAHLYMPHDGSWRKAELPGPPSIDDWWRSWMVFRCSLLLLNAVKPEPLELYGEHIRTLATDYGPACWFLVYQADVRMRSEEFERLRRRTAMEGQPDFDPSAPWGTVFDLAVREKDFWDAEVHQKSLLFLARVRTPAELTHDGTAQPGRGFTRQLVDAAWPDARRRRQGGPPRPAAPPPRRADDRLPLATPAPPARPPAGQQRPKQKASKKQQRVKPKKEAADKSGEICNMWNAGHCTPGACPHGRQHVCDKCGGIHRRINCPN